VSALDIGKTCYGSGSFKLGSETGSSEALLGRAAMNHVKYLRAGPAEMPFQNWYTANTNHFDMTDFCHDEIKSTTRLRNKHYTA